ncbi:hypothetical protein K438DRAFT_2008603 [Mycena galopus ATCC 62051]|nr:hypothetical protein K438DRAFT_2008603 [Mycena galopus ATCC 62051]
MCRGITDGIPCDCNAYDPPVDPKAPSLCRECAHGKSKHSDLPSTAAPHSSVKTKKSVLDVFTSRAEKTISERLPSKDRITDFGTAKQDTLRGFRVEDAPRQDASKKPKGKKKAGKGTEVAVKETVASKVVLFVSGVKNQQLQGSTKALTLVDIDLLGLHQCVATDVVIKDNTTHQDCTDLFERLFSPMFEWMAKNKKGGTWVIISKECHTLRVVPKARPNGADIAQYQIPKRKTQEIMLFIALTKTVPVDQYKSWFTGPVIQEPSSGIESDNEDVLMVASSNDNNSDYDPVRDPDAEDYGFSPRPVAFEKYQTRKDPVPSKRKMESVDNDIEQTAVKKQKIDSSVQTFGLRKIAGLPRAHREGCQGNHPSVPPSLRLRPIAPPHCLVRSFVWPRPTFQPSALYPSQHLRPERRPLSLRTLFPSAPLHPVALTGTCYVIKLETTADHSGHVLLASTYKNLA